MDISGKSADFFGAALLGGFPELAA